MDKANSTTFVDVLRSRASKQPQQRGYTFLLDDEFTEVHLTYAELDQQARSIAALLQTCEAVGERVLLLYPPGLDYISAFFGCLYGGTIAVPVYPPDPARLNRTLPRLQAIIADSQATIGLTTTPILSMVGVLFDQLPDLKAIRWLATDQISLDLSEQWQAPNLTGDSLAFLQYTSGSTAMPRGVRLAHSNLLHNSALIYESFGLDSDSRGVIWLPPYHDMGLIGGILQPLYGGFPTIFMSPIDFLKRPFRWLQAISRYKATVSGGPNFAYDLCVRKITSEERALLDLSSWELAFNGAEPVRYETIESFAKTFAPNGFRKEAFCPCYGLAEATLIVSGGPKTALPLVLTVNKPALARNQVEIANSTQPNTQVLIGCGSLLTGQHVLIINPETFQLCEPDQVGEIWISGSSVAQGYWAQPEKNAETFQAYLVNKGEGPFLRTGDLGFLRSGQLFVTGRLKDLIIIHGQNHYPQDIELTAEGAHPILRPGCCAAFSVQVAGEERLMVAQEVSRGATAQELDEAIEAIRRRVAEDHELQVYSVVLLQAGTIPKTSSGKIQRKECLRSFLSDGLEVVSRSTLDDVTSDALTPLTPQSEMSFVRKALNAIEEPAARHALLLMYLQEQVAHVLKVAPSYVDLQQPLSMLGFDSLMSVELQHVIETDLGVVLSIGDIFQVPSISQLASKILASLVASPVAPLSPVTAPHVIEMDQPLSHGQQAIWFVHRLAPTSAAYNIASIVRIRSELDDLALQHAFQSLVDHHQSLRASFLATPKGPVQRVRDRLEVFFHQEDASTWSEMTLNECLSREAHHPFDLEHDSLLRVYLFRRSEHEHILLLVVHHIVSDFWSLALLVKELVACYSAEKSGTMLALPPPNIQYIDYIHWQFEMLAGPVGEQLRKYWLEKLAGELPILNLPTDRPRAVIQSDHGASYRFSLDREIGQQLKALAKSEGATLYMTLLAAFQILLYRYTGQEDILVGSPVAGRSRAEFANLIGYLVNPVVLRGLLSGNMSFLTFLKQIRETVLDAFEHQDYPFSLLVQQLMPKRDASRSPIFQVMFVFQKAPLQPDDGLTALALGETGEQLRIGELIFEPIALQQHTVQFDLTLVMGEVNGILSGAFQYNTDIFGTATVARITDHFKTLLEGVANQPDQQIATLPLLSSAEYHQITREWNATRVEYPEDLCVHGLFERQVERTPDAAALVFEDHCVTYRELNRRANQLAHYLRELGVKPDVPVGIYLERSVELVIAIYGILKAGGAYVPLDPMYPRGRLAYMLADSRIPVLLTSQRLQSDLPENNARIVCLDADWDCIAQTSSSNPAAGISFENLAYIIYTSGSTGKPKGVMNVHGGIRNRVLWMQNIFCLTTSDRVLQKTPFSFDVSVWEFIGPLIAGACLVIARPEGHKDTVYLIRTIQEQQITMLHFVPSMLRVFMEDQNVPQCTSLHRVCCSGEALPYDLQERFFRDLKVDLHNLYGPTEASVEVTAWMCERDSDRQVVPIGFPINNTQIYLLDTYLNPVPVGVPGELHIGGIGLARGYLGRPDMTADKFIPSPFEDQPGSRLYKTGDLARYLSNGSIEFIGRIDHQVKVRGFRIELGEIEASLCLHPAVRDAVVVMRDIERSPGNQCLVAYIVPNSIDSPEIDELSSFLKQMLPDYMIPTAFVSLERLPLTSSGKVDRLALPTPVTVRSTMEKDQVSPRTDLESQLAKIWCEVLHLDAVGIYDNFFDLGGHSLLATQVISRIYHVFQVELPIHDLFVAPTIAGLASAIECSKHPPHSSDQVKMVHLPRGDRSINEFLASETDKHPD